MKRSLDAGMLLDSGITSLDQLKERGFELVQKQRERWISGHLLAIIANTPLTSQWLEFYPREGEGLVRIQIPKEIAGVLQCDKRCCLVAADREVCGTGEQLFWGLTREGEWIFVVVGFEYDQERKLKILFCRGVQDTFDVITKNIVKHSLQMLNGMHLMVWGHRERVRRIVADLDDEVGRTAYDGSVAQDRASALGWDSKVHGTMR
jgi:hypothetical protein